MKQRAWRTVRVTDWAAGQTVLRQRRYGEIETRGGQLWEIRLRPLPKLLAWPEIWPTASDYHARGDADRCVLYYNQPWRYPNFLALKYIVSTPGTSYGTSRAALSILDELARLKQIDALLCDAANSRISDRLLKRFGWTPHCQSRWHRNHIKRFYGDYPSTTSVSLLSSPTVMGPA